jgi:hypothetical protein
MSNPKVHTSLGDAREALLTTRERYDIIFSEPSNPYRAGISSLYTMEFYQAAQQRLNDHGIFIQWVQGYEVDGWCVATAMVTLRQVFKEVSLWRMMGGDLLVVAQNDPAIIDVERMRRRLTEEVYATAAKSVWRTTSVEGVLAHFVANPLLAEAMVKYELGSVNHDDQNVLEFAFARNVGHKSLVDDDLRNLAVRLHADTPRVNGPVNPERIFEERWLFQMVEGRPLDPPASAAPPSARAFGSVLELHHAGRFPGAFAAWASLEREPQSYFERMLVAETAPSVDDPRALAYLEAIESQGQRELMRGFRAIRRGEVEAAVGHLANGFELHRKDPWIHAAVGKVSLDVALDVARRVGKPAATRLYDALGEPFAAEALRLLRLSTRAKIGRVIDVRHCADAMHDLEPVPYHGELMKLRFECYEQTRDPLTEVARDDLARLTEWDGTFAAGLQLANAPADGSQAVLPPPPQRRLDGGRDGPSGADAASAGGTGEGDGGRGGLDAGSAEAGKTEPSPKGGQR